MQSREEMKNTAIYEKLINTVKQYFAHKDIYSILLHGGCYWLASALHEYIPDSDIVFHRQMQHFIPRFDIEAINAYLKNIMQKERTVCYVEN